MNFRLPDLTVASALLLMPALPAAAAALARVDAVQAPAWIVRGDQSVPLQAGMEVKSGDRIGTGADGRASIRLAEGSTVRLGAATQFAFYSQSRRPAQNFRGAIDIASGVFRLTTDARARQANRELTVRIGTSTLAVHDADVLGRATPEEDVVLLADGQVDIRRGAEAVNLSAPMTQYRAPRGADMLPPTRADGVAWVVLARDTDIRTAERSSTTSTPGPLAVSKNGRWKLRLPAVATQSEALMSYDTLNNAGYPARIQVRPGPAYIVYVGGLVSAEAANDAAAGIKARTGMEGRVGR